MDREKITAWVTKFALITGIEKVEGEADENYLRYDKHGSAFGNDWHRTREAAIKRAEEMRLKKIASVEKQLGKLKKMRFE